MINDSKVESYHVHPTKGKKLPAEPMTADEVRALMDACSRRAPTGIRNRALIALLWRSGLRISEALGLFPKDCDPVAGALSVLHGKGDKRRTVGMDAEAFAVLDRWMDRRQVLALNGRARLFCTLDGKPLQTAYVRALLKRLSTRAGIEKRVHPHALRHTHAAELAKEGLPLNVIQAQLGHSSAATTARYLNHIAPQQVLDAMQKRSWGA